MPVDPQVIDEAGPWVTLAAVLIGIIVTAATAFVKGWIIPGWLYQRSEARAEKATIQAERTAEAMEAISKSYEVMARNYDRQERELGRPTSRRVNRDTT